MVDVEAELERIWREAVPLWNAHRFFDFHDKLEEAWQRVKHEKKREPARDPRRDLVHGLILLAAAYVQWGRRNPLGVTRHLTEARRLLSSAPSQFLGQDLRPFLRAVQQDLERGSGGQPFQAEGVPRL